MITRLSEWIEANEALLASFGAVSVATFLVSLLVLPWIIILLPADYFIRPNKIPERIGPFRLVLRILKNALGLLIFVLGILMLFLPGQGILALLIGCSLVDFPGKRRLQLALLRNRRVRRTVDWIRRKADREPLEIPEEVAG